MGERFFNVNEAAEIMGCHRATVYRLIAEGWLKPPGGRPKENEGARVSEKSVYQVMICDHLSQFPTKTLKEFGSGRKNFSKLLSQTSNANRFSKVEETGITPDAASSSVLPKNNEAQQRLHFDFAAEHQFSFGWIARQLLPGDAMSLQDDLVQEMSLAVLEYKKPANCEYLLKLAENRAIDYLRYEETRGMMPLSEAREVSDSFEKKMENLRNLIDALLQRGVPREWIDEVLGRFEDEQHETGMGLGVAV